MRDRASAHTDGTSTTRVCRSRVAISSTGSNSLILAYFRKRARSSGFVPHVGTAAKGTSGIAPASAVKIEIPFTAHGFTISTNWFWKLPMAE